MKCRAIVVLSERVEYTVQRALFRSLGTAIGGTLTAAPARDCDCVRLLASVWTVCQVVT